MEIKTLFTEKINSTINILTSLLEKIKSNILAIISSNEVLNYYNYVNRKYSLQIALQDIYNKDGTIQKKELLIRSTEEKNLSKLLEEIENNDDNFKLFCFVFLESLKLRKNFKISINVNISDILHKDFYELLNFIGLDLDGISIEILETEKLPTGEESEEFFNRLRILKNRKAKILLDDIGGIEQKGKQIYSNEEFIKKFFSEKVLDGIKLDKDLVRELYLLYILKINKADIGEKTYNLEQGDNILEHIKNFHKFMKKSGLEIYAEGIDKFTFNLEEIGNIKGFTTFLKEELLVDYFQGFHFHKPESYTK